VKDVFRFGFYAFILILIAIFLPLGGGIFYFFSCLPFFYLALKQGLSRGFLALLLVTLMMFVTVPPFFTVTYVILFGSLITFWYRGVLNRSSGSWLIVGGSILMAVMGLTLFLFLKGLEPELVTREMTRLIALVEKQTQQAGLSQEMVPAFVKFFSHALIGILFVSTLLSLGITYKVGEWVFKKRGLSLPPVDIALWRPSEVTVWGLIISGYFYWMSLKADFPILRLVGLNLGVIFMGIYFLSGVSLISYYFRYYKVSLGMRIMGFLLLLWQPLVVVGLGVVDVWADFRKRNPNKKGREG